MSNPTIAILGKPNVGKSTLFNRLVGYRHSIVSPKEGITRDIIRKIQNLRKDSGFQVDDRIIVNILAEDQIINAVNKNKQYFS